MILYEFFARFSSGLGFCALFRPTRRFSFIGLFRLSYLELVLLNPINGAYSNNGVVHRALLHRGYENVHRGTIETATAVGTGM